MHFDTGLLWVDVEDDFNRARRRQMLARLAGWLRGQPGHVSRILPLDEVVAALGWRGEHYLGLQTIQLDTVAGTVDSRRDFDRKFRPTSNRVRQRWERLDLAQRRGVSLPPIDVYRVGDLHFVMDGHHRVSVASSHRAQDDRGACDRGADPDASRRQLPLRRPAARKPLGPRRSRPGMTTQIKQR